MATLDLAALLTAVQELEAQIEGIVFGLEDLVLVHLTTAERNQLQTLTDTYRTMSAVTVALANGARALQALGYPTLPTLDVGSTLVAKLEAEIANQEAALALLHAQAEAVRGTLTFEPPIEKKP